jgi:glycosyltransferase involved in cell wall biosynthesis
MKINIAISAYNRPEYLQRCISALYGAKGFSTDKYDIFCVMDCFEDGSFNNNVLDVFFYNRLVPHITPKKLGCNYTIKKALEMAWADNPDFVLMLEDDIIISDDALQYIEWAANKYKDDGSVRTIGLWGHDDGWKLGSPLPDNESGKVMRQNYFTCWGWGTWKDRWKEMNTNWTTGNDSHDTSWDVIVSSHLGDRVEILPSLSRAYNCGEHGGTHRGRAWPGIVASGFIDPDGEIAYWEHHLPKKDEEWPVYVILGRFGDIYMVCKKLKQPSIICCMSQFAKIVYDLFPQHKVFELGNEYAREPQKAAIMAKTKYPTKKVTICQQDGQDPKLVLPFRSFQAFQEYYAQL